MIGCSPCTQAKTPCAPAIYILERNRLLWTDSCHHSTFTILCTNHFAHHTHVIHGKQQHQSVGSAIASNTKQVQVMQFWYLQAWPKSSRQYRRIMSCRACNPLSAASSGYCQAWRISWRKCANEGLAHMWPLSNTHTRPSNQIFQRATTTCAQKNQQH